MEDVLVTEERKPVVLKEQVILAPEHFWTVPTDDLINLRKTAATVVANNNASLASEHMREAEQLYKESSLELLFRKKGEDCRYEYDKWLEIKQRKKRMWEQQMQAKYGDEWKEQVTDADRRLLVYSDAELRIYKIHKLIETEAMQLQEKDIKKEEDAVRANKVDFFKLVERRTLELYQFLDAKEVHKAVLSIEFLFFYMRQIARSIVRRGLNRMSGRQVAIQVEYERNLYEATSVVKEIVIQRRIERMFSPSS